MVKIDNQNMQCKLVGAAFLQLNKVRDTCVDFLITRLNTQLGIRQFADSSGCPQWLEWSDWEEIENGWGNVYVKVIKKRGSVFQIM